MSAAIGRPLASRIGVELALFRREFAAEFHASTSLNMKSFSGARRA